MAPRFPSGSGIRRPLRAGSAAQAVPAAVAVVAVVAVLTVLAALTVRAPELTARAGPGSVAPDGGEGPAALAAGAEALHTRLEATFPAADSLFRGEVTEVRLRYSTAVQLPLSTVRVLGPGGAVLSAAGPDTVPGSGSASIRVRFAEPLPTGAYTVEWRTAGPDGHPIEGDYGFEVERPEPTPEPDTAGGAEGEPGQADPAAGPGADPGAGDDVPMVAAGSGAGAAGPRPVGVAVRWLFFASIVGMLGSSVFRLAVVPALSREPGWEEAARAGRRGLLRLALGAAVLGAVALPARFGVQAATFFGGVDGLTAAAAWNLLSTGWGLGWILQAGALTIFIGGLVLVRGRPRAGWLLMLAGGAVVSVVPALSGHSRAVDADLRSLAMVVDALHVAAAGIWLGGLGALVLVGVGAARRATGDEAGRALPAVVDAFSRVALTAVAALFATGIVNAWLHLGSLSALWGSAYGRTLAVKLALVAVVAALGFYNWRVVRPALRQTPRPALLRVPASVELLVGVAILLATAVLVASPLPGS